MMTDGVKTANQIQFQDENGNPTVPVVGANGGVLVEAVSGEAGGASKSTVIGANYITVGTAEVEVTFVATKISKISVANYSETNSLTVNVAGKAFNIGPNVAVDLLVNAEGLASITFISDAEDVKVQYVIEGVV